MSLQDKIGVNARYTRSANLERDIDSLASVEAYIPTARARATLERIVAGFDAADTPRAWSLVGPYGSGKSSFAVFLTHLLADPAYETGTAARRVLSDSAPALAERFARLSAGTAGHCCVLLTGGPQPLASRLASALYRGARSFWSDRPGLRRPAILGVLEKLAERARPPLGDVEHAVRQLQDAVAHDEGNGLLLVIDELGKFLEYEARHGANDLYLLQSLAEHALRGHRAPLNLVVLLHQSFEQYALRLGEAQRNEWSKIQGRFEHIPFLDTPEQVLRIVSAACRKTLDVPERQAIRALARHNAERLGAEGALPAALGLEDAADLLADCYPLHPVAALLLPSLCQRVAQNDRTLFSYLGSQEPHGFRDSLARLRQIGDTISPAEIYDYFILNQPAASTSHQTYRRWNEVATALERLGDAPPAQIALLKTIGLLNIVGAQGGLKASPSIVALCAGEAAQPLLDDLLKRAILQFRRFGNEYRVWAGSDLDLDAELARARAEHARLDLAAALARRAPLKPLVARRHSIASGTLRYFEPIYTDLDCREPASGPSRIPRLVLILVESEHEQPEVLSLVRTLPPGDVAVACTHAAELREQLVEVLACESIPSQVQGLQGDPVAQRELRERQRLAERRLERSLSRVFDHPNERCWYWQGRELPIGTKGDLQRALSVALDTLYCRAPLMRNELINRDQPSSQAAAGRNKLLAAMLENPHREALGIEKFPPEKAMYLALLRAPGLHRCENGVWDFRRPPDDDPYRFAPLFCAIDAYLEAREGAPREVADLFVHLSAPPFGIKAGALPVLLVAYYSANQRETALYEDGVFCPAIGAEHFELLARRPERFAIERFALHGARLTLFRKYLAAIVGEIPEQATLLDIVRPLARFMRALPAYAQKASHLGEAALAIRAAFPRARGPAALLFEILPTACGFPPIAVADHDEQRLDDYLGTLVAALRELRDAYAGMIDDYRRQLARVFNLDPGLSMAQLRQALTARFRGLDRYAGAEQQDLGIFIRRLTATHHEDAPWLESLMTLLGKTPPAKWGDEQRQHAIAALGDIAPRLKDLETLDRAVQARPARADAEVVLLRAVSSATGERPGQVAYISPEQRPLIEAQVSRIEALLADVQDRDLRLAVIARLLHCAE